MRFCLFLLAALLPAAARAEAPVALSLNGAMLFALHNNPDAMIAQEQAVQAAIAVREAKSALYPQVSASLSAGLEYNRPTSTPSVAGGGDTVPSGEARLLVNQLVYDGHATEEEIERRKWLRNSADLNTKRTFETLMTDTVRTYAAVWRFQQAVAESERFVDTIGKTAEKVTLMVESGAESNIKKEFSDSRLANARTQLNNAKSNLSSALNQLESLTGRLPDFAATRPEQLDPTLRKLDRYFRDAQDNNVVLAQNRSDLAALTRERAAQLGRDLPTVTLQAEARKSDNDGGDTASSDLASVMLVANYSIFDGHAKKSTRKRIESQMRENTYRQSKLQREVKRDLRFAYNQLQAIKDEYLSAQEEIISSESLQALYQKQFELGEGDIINLIEGEERLYAAKTRALRLEAEMIVNSYVLLRDAGLLEKEDFCVTC
jgi:adhesin transport system outer membrane protein